MWKCLAGRLEPRRDDGSKRRGVDLETGWGEGLVWLGGGSQDRGWLGWLGGLRTVVGGGGGEFRTGVGGGGGGSGQGLGGGGGSGQGLGGGGGSGQGLAGLVGGLRTVVGGGVQDRGWGGGGFRTGVGWFGWGGGFRTGVGGGGGFRTGVGGGGGGSGQGLAGLVGGGGGFRTGVGRFGWGGGAQDRGWLAWLRGSGQWLVSLVGCSGQGLLGWKLWRSFISTEG